MLQVGDRLGRFEVVGQLGEGGWGQVVRGRDAAGGVEVAIKVARSDNPVARARFLREGRIAAAIEHGNVVRVVEVGESEGTPFIAMELVPGAAMSGHLGSARIPIQRRLDWLVQAARGLSAVHDAGLVHRDVKPANLMIMPDGVVKLIDFGLAKSLVAAGVSEALTERGAAVGTPAYMAPEQLAGAEIDPRADQFAWGLVGFALVTGTRLRVDDPALPPADALQRRLLEGGVSEPVAAVLLRAFRLPRDERFASMREAGDALLAAIPSIAAEKLPPLFCPRCATRLEGQLEGQRRCPRCDRAERADEPEPSETPAPHAMRGPWDTRGGAPRGRVVVGGGTATAPAVAGDERGRWSFEERAPDRPLTLELATLRSDGLVIGIGAGRAFVLAAGGARELAPIPIPNVRCVTTRADGDLWVGAEGGAAARFFDAGVEGGAWTVVRGPEGSDSPMSVSAAPGGGGVFLAGARPGGGVVCLLSRHAQIARLERDLVVRAVVGTDDNRAFGVSSTTLFRTSGYGMSTIDTGARGPLLAVAAAGDSVFAVGMDGAAIHYRISANTVTHDDAETRWNFAQVCAVGPALAYATAGHGAILRRDPARGTWQQIGGPYGTRRPRAIAGDEQTVTVVLDDGAVVHGRRS